jgi:DNA-binding transcriptional ArsR family regulator
VPQTPSRTFKSAAYAHLAEVGKALSSPARLEMLELLAQAPRTVDVLAGEIDQSVANTSHHLQALKRAQLVTARRDGVHVIYSLAGADVAALLVQLQAVAAQHIAGLEKLTREFFDDPDGLEAVDRDTLLERLRANDVVLLDVRPEHEFASGPPAWGALGAAGPSRRDSPTSPPPHHRRLLPRPVLHALGRGGPAPARPRLRRAPQRRLDPQPGRRGGFPMSTPAVRQAGGVRHGHRIGRRHEHT